MNDEAAARRQQRLRTFLVSATTSGEMLCRIGNMHHIAGAGRGIGMTLGTGTPVSFFLDGLNSASVVLRDAADEALALEVNNRKYTPGTHVSMWAPLEHPEWSMPWHLNEDATLSPVDMQTTRVQREVVLGWSTSNPHAKILSLVDKKSPNRLCVQLSGALLSLAPRQASQSDAILSIASPACSILGQDTRKAFGLSGHVYVLKKHNGRGQGLSICPVQEAALWTIDGNLDNCVLRLKDDEGLALEVNHRQFKPGDVLSVWSIDNHPEWACRWHFASVGGEDLARFEPDQLPFHLSPIHQGHVIHDVVIGVDDANDSTSLVLTQKDSPNAIVFEALSDSIGRYRRNIEQHKAAEKRRTNALALHIAEVVSEPSFIKSLREDGFCKVSGLVPEPLIRSALTEINRQLGQPDAKGVDRLKGKVFPTQPAITDLFNKSGIPMMLARLLQPPPPGAGPFVQGGGQIALRFPGDACEKGTCVSSPAHFNAVRKGWHIDGCPSDFVKGMTDHYGKIHNFDCLVGVLLNRVDEPMSGELCVYPGSHQVLSDYWKKHGLEKLAREGQNAQPTAQTDELFKRRPVHGLGMPGDVFFANFMTAHFIAPNTSPFIRYAIYFRVKSHRFGTALHNSASMLDPWAHWDCMQTDADPVEGSANSRTSDARSSNGEESGGCVAATAVPETVEFSDHDDAMVYEAQCQHDATVDNLALQEQIVGTSS